MATSSREDALETQQVQEETLPRLQNGPEALELAPVVKAGAVGHTSKWILVALGSLVVGLAFAGAIVGGTSVIWNRSSDSSATAATVPSAAPFNAPTSSPSHTPSVAPTTVGPSPAPTSSSPSQRPSPRPTRTPTLSPLTSHPSMQPSTSHPSKQPSSSRPSHAPSLSPSTSRPSTTPTTTKPSRAPTSSRPSLNPSTSRPSVSPITSKPTSSPSTSLPTISPTNQPTYQNCPQETIALSNLYRQIYCDVPVINSMILSITGRGPIKPERCLNYRPEGIWIRADDDFILFTFSVPVRKVSYSYTNQPYGAGNYNRIEEPYGIDGNLLYSTTTRNNGCLQTGGIGCSVNAFNPIKLLIVRPAPSSNLGSFISGIQFTPVTC